MNHSNIQGGREELYFAVGKHGNKTMVMNIEEVKRLYSYDAAKGDFTIYRITSVQEMSAQIYLHDKKEES